MTDIMTPVPTPEPRPSVMSALTLPLTALKRGHIVDPHGWTVAQCYGDKADAYANEIVTAVNSHARLLAAAKEALDNMNDGRPDFHPSVRDVLHTAITEAERRAP